MEKEENYRVSNDDILGGIKAAISRGETLKQAMITLFNAGYSKGEIEDAARKYMMGKSEEAIYSESSKKDKNKKEKKKEEEKKLTPESPGGPESKNISRSPGMKPGTGEEKISEKKDLQKKEEKSEDKKVKPLPTINAGKKVEQKASKYDTDKPQKKRKIEPVTILLIVLLLLLLGVLVAVFMFKAELVEFFNNLFG
jgi:cobalamin biosynthesis Mg chelatase CobN